jgi:hydrogenase maturation protease
MSTNSFATYPSRELRSEVVVAGFGSPHGDDQAGWHVVELLKRRPNLPARLVTIVEGTQLIDVLPRCRRLIVADACRSGPAIGTVSRFAWPDPRVRQYHNHSTHGVGLCNALELAEQLGYMPPEVEVFGIEIGDVRPLDGMTAEVARAVAALEEVIFCAICEERNARALVG